MKTLIRMFLCVSLLYFPANFIMGEDYSKISGFDAWCCINHFDRNKFVEQQQKLLGLSFRNLYSYKDGQAIFKKVADILLLTEEISSEPKTTDILKGISIANAINNRGVLQVAIVGYSHGGGTVYNLSKRLFYDGQTTRWYGVNRLQSNIIDDSKTYPLTFTSYIDAIENTGWLSGDAEIRKPLGSVYHLNQYQTSGSYAGGTTIGGGIMENIDRTGTVIGSTLINSFAPHIMILYEESVLYILKTRFLSNVNR